MNFRNSPGDYELTNTRGCINTQTQMFLKPRLLGNAGYDLESGRRNMLLTCASVMSPRCVSGWSFWSGLRRSLSLEGAAVLLWRRGIPWEPSGPIKASGFRGLKIHFSICRNIKRTSFSFKGVWFKLGSFLFWVGTGLRPFHSAHTGLEPPGCGEWCEFPGPPGCWDTGAPSHLATDMLYTNFIYASEKLQKLPLCKGSHMDQEPSLSLLGFPGYCIRDFSALLLKPQSLASLTDESYRQNTGEEDRTMGIKLHI